MEVMKVFNVEELHRGEWQPLMVKDKTGKKVQKSVKITEEQAERMNVYSDDYRIRYIASGDSPKAKKKAKKQAKKEVEVPSREYSAIEFSGLRDEYEELKGKKAFNGWSADVVARKIEELKESN
jgi:hypothetical protein